MLVRSVGGVAVLAVAALITGSGSASAADSTVGALITTATACGGEYTILQTASAGPSYAVPSGGVITSVRYSAGAAGIRSLKVARGSGASFTIVGSADRVSVPANQTVSQDVRIPAQAGDILGEYVSSGGACVASTGNAADETVFANGELPADPNAVSFTGPIGGTRLSVEVTVEPDADHDGYGDTTQDRCPTDASTQGLCPSATQPTPVVPAAAPVTVAAVHRGHHRIRVTASGLGAGEQYTITIGRYTVATGTATSAGAVDERVKVAACVFPGNRLVRVLGTHVNHRGSDRINIGRPRADRCS